MATVNVYLTFNGNTEEAFKDMPTDENCPPPSEEEGNRIMHVSLPISKETILMGSDSTSFSGDVTFGNNFSVSINADSKEEADTLFNGLSAGGQIEMPISDSPWGSYFGMFRDKYGIEWMVDFDPKYKGQI